MFLTSKSHKGMMTASFITILCLELLLGDTSQRVELSLQG